MKLLNLILLLGVFILQLVAARKVKNHAEYKAIAAQPHAATSSGADMMFKGVLGGHEVELNGTIQQVFAQMKELYPDWNPEDDLEFDNTTLAVREENNVNAKIYPFLCYPVAGQPWQRCSTPLIRAGIRQMKARNALCKVPANVCVIAWCYHDASIQICNDNPYPIEPGCSYIATYAQDLIDSCNHHIPGLCEDCTDVCGQEFDTDRYNVVVTKASCPGFWPIVDW